MNDKMACEVLFATRQLIGALGQVRLSVQFGLPQTWPLAALRQRWPGLDAEAIAQIARDRVGYQGETKALLLSLDEVIACDAVIAERLRAQRGAPTYRRAS